MSADNRVYKISPQSGWAVVYLFDYKNRLKPGVEIEYAISQQSGSFYIRGADGKILTFNVKEERISQSGH